FRLMDLLPSVLSVRSLAMIKALSPLAEPAPGAAAAILAGSVMATFKLSAILRVGWMIQLSPSAGTPEPIANVTPPKVKGIGGVTPSPREVVVPSGMVVTL